MLQYLLNATAIWLISLVLFDVLLRRESYHAYNRFYLLFTFLLGALLPLWQWQEDSYLIKAAEQPLERVIRAKQNIVSVASDSNGSLDWQQIWTVIYLTGMVVAASLLIIDIFKLLSFYKTGSKSQQQDWTIIETARNHAPFSFLNALFVCSMEQYTKEEWTMILTHEKAHTNLLHFADLVLMQLARIIFWFHPLEYVYNKRLIMTHEYQADRAAAAQPQEYGRFLVHQALFQASPSLTHSFNRSPIKNRIIMLSQNSSSAARIKMLLFVPLVTVCFVFFSKNGIAQNAGTQKPYVKVGNTNAPQSDITHCTVEQILANPVLVPQVPDCEVIDFSISFMEKGGTMEGPFKTAGASIRKEQIAMLQGYKGKKTRIYIEDIHVKYNGKEMDAKPVLMQCDH